VDGQAAEGSITGTVVEDLRWYATSYGDVFPGCKDCCEVTLSPMAHEAMDSYPLTELDTDVMPIMRAIVDGYHSNGHTFLAKSPLAIPRKRKPKEVTS